MRRLLPAAAVLLLVSVPVVRAQSLGEIAKKEAERRKAAEAAKAGETKPAEAKATEAKPEAKAGDAKAGEARTGQAKPAKKVYTNSDLKPAPAPSAAQPAPAAAAPAKPAEGDKAEQKTDEKGDEYWRARMGSAREDLRRNEMFRDALQTRINSLSNDFAARDDPYQRAQIGDQRQKALAELDRVTKEIDNIKKQIADIEEEARQAGVPPGWIR
jgi:chromosome segregation ATPase